MQLVHLSPAPLVLLEREVLLVGASRAVLHKESRSVLNLRRQKRKQDSSEERQDAGDKYRIKHQLITRQKRRRVQGLGTKAAGRYHLTAGRKRRAMPHQVQLRVCLSPAGGAWRRVRAHPRRAAGPSGTDWNASSCCPHHLPP